MCMAAQSVPNALGPLLESWPVAERPPTCPDTAEDAPVSSLPDAEKPPAASAALPRRIVFECDWLSEQTARQAKRIDSTDVDVTVKEIGNPWLVVPTKSRDEDVTPTEGAVADRGAVRVETLLDPPQPATTRITSRRPAAVRPPRARRVVSELGRRRRLRACVSISLAIDRPPPPLERAEHDRGT